MTITSQALVVDDEPSIRWLVSAALTKEGFACDTAENGEIAFRQINGKRYDLVVTDLRMPRRHGHSLAMDLLAEKERPLVVVLTGVIDPRLAKDLIARGVDDIEFKPIEFSVFAAKLRSLVDRRGGRATPSKAKPEACESPRVATPTNGRHTIEKEAIYERLGNVKRLLPMSEAAVDVFRLTSGADTDVHQIAAAVQRDPALMTEVLRLANSSFFNASAGRITNVDQAVKLLGQHRVGELALGFATVSSAAQKMVPFLNLTQIWQRCLAAGICLEILSERMDPSFNPDGLLVAALLHPVGRIILATLFPDDYQKMLRECDARKCSLDELETSVFAKSPGKVAASILAEWGIPEEIHRPLRYLGLSFGELSTLTEPTRSRVELTKLAVLVGELVVGRFESWDRIDLPDPSTASCGLIGDLPDLVRCCREDLGNIVNFTAGESTRCATELQGSPPEPEHELAYLSVAETRVDFLPELFACADVRLVDVRGELEGIDGSLLINCLGSSPEEALTLLRTHRDVDVLSVVTADLADRVRPFGRVLKLPCSFETLRSSSCASVVLVP